jgi:hypothetical protein
MRVEVRGINKPNLAEMPRLRVGVNSFINNVGGKERLRSEIRNMRVQVRPKEVNTSPKPREEIKNTHKRILIESNFKQFAYQPNIVNEGLVKKEEAKTLKAEISKITEVKRLEKTPEFKVLPKGKQRFIETALRKIELSQKKQSAEKAKIAPQLEAKGQIQSIKKPEIEKINKVDQQRLEAVKKFLNQQQQVVRKVEEIAQPQRVEKPQVSTPEIAATKKSSQAGLVVLEERMAKIKQQNGLDKKAEQLVAAQGSTPIELTDVKPQPTLAEVVKLTKEAEKIQESVDSMALLQPRVKAENPRGVQPQLEASAGILGQEQVMIQIKALQERVKQLKKQLLEEEEKKKKLEEEEQNKKLMLHEVKLNPKRDENAFKNREEVGLEAVKQAFDNAEVDNEVSGETIARLMPQETAKLRSAILTGLPQPDGLYSELLENMTKAGKFENIAQAIATFGYWNTYSSPVALGDDGIAVPERNLKVALNGQQDAGRGEGFVYSGIYQELVKIRLELTELTRKASVARFQDIKDEAA